MRLRDAERVEEAGEVVGEIVDGRGRGDRLGAAVAAGVVAEAAVAPGEGGDLRVPHRERRADRMGEGDHRRVGRPGQLVVEVHAVGADMRHAQLFLPFFKRRRTRLGLGDRAVDHRSGGIDRGRRCRAPPAPWRGPSPGVRHLLGDDLGEAPAGFADQVGGILDQLVRRRAGRSLGEDARPPRRRQAGRGSRRDLPPCGPGATTSPSASVRASRSAPEARPKSWGRACHSPCHSADRPLELGRHRVEQRDDVALRGGVSGEDDDRRHRVPLVRHRRGAAAAGNVRLRHLADLGHRQAGDVGRHLGERPDQHREPGRRSRPSGRGARDTRREGRRGRAPSPSPPSPPVPCRRARRACRPGRRATPPARARGAGAGRPRPRRCRRARGRRHSRRSSARRAGRASGRRRASGDARAASRVSPARIASRSAAIRSKPFAICSTSAVSRMSCVVVAKWKSPRSFSGSRASTALAKGMTGMPDSLDLAAERREVEVLRRDLVDRRGEAPGDESRPWPRPAPARPRRGASPRSAPGRRTPRASHRWRRAGRAARSRWRRRSWRRLRRLERQPDVVLRERGHRRRASW